DETAHGIDHPAGLRIYPWLDRGDAAAPNADVSDASVGQGATLDDEIKMHDTVLAPSLDWRSCGRRSGQSDDWFSRHDTCKDQCLRNIGMLLEVGKTDDFRHDLLPALEQTCNGLVRDPWNMAQPLAGLIEHGNRIPIVRIVRFHGKVQQISHLEVRQLHFQRMEVTARDREIEKLDRPSRCRWRKTTRRRKRGNQQGN